MEDNSGDDDAYDDYYVWGYENYEQTTVDPGPWFFYGTAILMGIMFLSIWPLVWMGRKWKKYRKARKLAKAAFKEAGDMNRKGKLDHPYFEYIEQEKQVSTKVPSLQPWPVKKDAEPFVINRAAVEKVKATGGASFVAATATHAFVPTETLETTREEERTATGTQSTTETTSISTISWPSTEEDGEGPMMARIRQEFEAKNQVGNEGTMVVELPQAQQTPLPQSLPSIENSEGVSFKTASSRGEPNVVLDAFHQALQSPLPLSLPSIENAEGASANNPSSQGEALVPERVPEGVLIEMPANEQHVVPGTISSLSATPSQNLPGAAKAGSQRLTMASGDDMHLGRANQSSPTVPIQGQSAANALYGSDAGQHSVKSEIPVTPSANQPSDASVPQNFLSPERQSIPDGILVTTAMGPDFLGEGGRSHASNQSSSLVGAGPTMQQHFQPVASEEQPIVNSLAREQEQRCVQDNIFLDTMDQILDPYIYESSEDRPTEQVLHENEEGAPDGILIELQPTSILDQRPFVPKQKLFSGATHGNKHTALIEPEQFDDEDEDAVPENAFGEYYRESDDDDDEADSDTPLKTKMVESTFNLDSLVQETTRGWTTFIAVIRCDKESRKIAKLAMPATFQAVSGAFFDAMSTALISKNIGPEAFTAYSMVGVFLGITDSLISGVGSAETTLTAQAIGMENYFLAGQYAQLTSMLYVIMAIPTYGMWIFVAPQIILALDIGEEVAEITRQYIPIAVFSYLLNGLAGGLSTLLWSAGYGNSMTVIDTVFTAMYMLALLVATNVGDITLNTVAWIGIVYAVAYGSFVFMFTKCRGWLDIYWKGLARSLALKNLTLIRGVLRMAIPLSLGTLMAEGEWEILTFFAAYMGSAEVAAWSIAGSIWGVFEYAPGGISSAAEIRIGFHLGNGNPMMAKLAAYKSLFYSAVWSASVTTLFAVFSSEIINLFTDDATLAKMLADVVPYMALANVLVCLGNDAFSIITAQTRPKLCTRIYFICTWFVVVPASAYLVIVKQYGLPAIVASVTCAYGAVAVCFLYVVFTSNWAKISKKILTRAEELDKPSKKGKADQDILIAQDLPNVV